MSRYIKHLDNGKVVAYGHDHVLGYFIDVFDGTDEDGDDILIVEKSSLTGNSNGDILEAMEHYEIRNDHCSSVALDLTF